MKDNITKIFALIVAISAVILLGFYAVDYFQQWEFTLSSEGPLTNLELNRKAHEAWTFIESMRNVWVGIVVILSILFLCFCWKKKETDSE